MRTMILAALIASATPAAAQQQPVQNAQSIWRPVAGGVEHLQSGLVCPDRLGGFDRAHNHNFDGYGLDVSGLAEHLLLDSC